MLVCFFFFNLRWLRRWRISFHRQLGWRLCEMDPSPAAPSADGLIRIARSQVLPSPVFNGPSAANGSCLAPANWRDASSHALHFLIGLLRNGNVASQAPEEEGEEEGEGEEACHLIFPMTTLHLAKLHRCEWARRMSGSRPPSGALIAVTRAGHGMNCTLPYIIETVMGKSGGGRTATNSH